MAAALLVGALFVQTGSASAETLTLEQAIVRASDAALRLRADDAAIDAARANRRQANARPNPTVTITGENLVGSGPYNVLAQSEITATYGHTLERGGKRDARMAYAQRGIDVAEVSSRVTRLDLAADVQRAFIDVQIADQSLKIADDRLSIELDLQREALRRVRGYKDPLFVETRAEARVAQAHIDVQQARRKQSTARMALAAFWGGNGEDLDVKGELLRVGTGPAEIADADEALEAARVARAQAGVVLEETKWAQDYTLSGGARYLRGTNDVALIASVTIPIGRFDRNQGNIERAQAERRRIELTAEAERLEKLRRLAALRANADTAHARVEAIVREVFPRTTRTLEQVRAGYNRGGFTFRDMQDAADAIIEVQAQWLATVTEWRDMQTEIDRLSGRFDTTGEGETQQ